MWPEPAPHSSADLGLQSCHRQSFGLAPGDKRAIFQDGSKCTTVCALNLLHTLQLILDCRAVTATTWTAPGDNRAIFQDGSKCKACGLNLLHTLQLILDCRALTATNLNRPQVTTEPSSKMAANACCLWPEPAAHSSADLGLQSCHRQNLDNPR